MADQNAITYWIWMNRLILFLTILDIFDDESVNLKFRNKKMATPKWPTKY